MGRLSSASFWWTKRCQTEHCSITTSMHSTFAMHEIPIIWRVPWLRYRARESSGDTSSSQKHGNVIWLGAFSVQQRRITARRIRFVLNWGRESYRAQTWRAFMSRISTIRVRTIAISSVVLAALAGMAVAADRYTLQVPNGLAFSDFRGYEDWQVVSIAQTDEVLKAIVANPAMIAAYKAGVPGNGGIRPSGRGLRSPPWDRRCGRRCRPRAASDTFTPEGAAPIAGMPAIQPWLQRHGDELTPELWVCNRPQEQGVGARWQADPRPSFPVLSSALSGRRCTRKRYSLRLTARALRKDTRLPEGLPHANHHFGFSEMNLTPDPNQ